MDGKVSCIIVKQFNVSEIILKFNDSKLSVGYAEMENKKQESRNTHGMHITKLVPKELPQ